MIFCQYLFKTAFTLFQSLYLISCLQVSGASSQGGYGQVASPLLQLQRQLPQFSSQEQQALSPRPNVQIRPVSTFRIPFASPQPGGRNGVPFVSTNGGLQGGYPSVSLSQPQVPPQIQPQAQAQYQAQLQLAEQARQQYFAQQRNVNPVPRPGLGGETGLNGNSQFGTRGPLGNSQLGYGSSPAGPNIGGNIIPAQVLLQQQLQRQLLRQQEAGRLIPGTVTTTPIAGSPFIGNGVTGSITPVSGNLPLGLQGFGGGGLSNSGANGQLFQNPRPVIEPIPIRPQVNGYQSVGDAQSNPTNPVFFLKSNNGTHFTEQYLIFSPKEQALYQVRAVNRLPGGGQADNSEGGTSAGGTSTSVSTGQPNGRAGAGVKESGDDGTDSGTGTSSGGANGNVKTGAIAPGQLRIKTRTGKASRFSTVWFKGNRNIKITRSFASRH